MADSADCAGCADFHVSVLSMFPAMFPGPLAYSLLGKGLDNQAWSLQAIDLAEFSDNKHRRIDDAPYGGGPGMVMGCEAIDRAITRHHRPGHALIYVTPRGHLLDHHCAHHWAQGRGMTILCGRFEGIDERIITKWQPQLVAVGHAVLSGGEIAAMAVIDATIRLRAGIIGNAQSLCEESFENDRLEYPHYTRPALWQGLGVPEVLLSGDHQAIAAWRQAAAARLTRQYRPDLWQKNTAAAQKAKVHLKSDGVRANTRKPRLGEEL